MAYAARFAEWAHDHLDENEEVELALRASVPPTMQVMAGITGVAVFGTMSLTAGVPALSLRLTIVVLRVAVIVAAYSAYASVGFSGPIGPYVLVGLTQRRILIFRRDLLGRLQGEPLVAGRADVTAEMRRRSFLLPNRLTLDGVAAEPLPLDVPRIEPAPAFVAALEN